MAVLLVVHDDVGPSVDDSNLIATLEFFGHTVDTALETAALPDAGYDAVIVTESGSSGSTAIGSIQGCQLPVMMFETSVDTPGLATAGMTSSSTGSEWDLQGDPQGLNAGFDDPLTVNLSASSFWGVAASALPAGAEVLAVGQGTTHVVAWLIDTGGLDSGDNPVPARRAAMGLITSRLSGILDDLSAGGSAQWFNGVVVWLAASVAPPQGSASGVHAWAGQAVGTNRPATPANLQAVAVSDSQIDLTWDAVTGVSGYDIERDGVVIVLDHATTSYSDTGLDPQTSYDYRVRAVE